jgi:PilZ domain
MNEKDSGNQASNQRVCDRINITRILLLELDNGDILRGRTVDVSPRGALMETEAPAETGLPGSAGTLFIISDNGQFSTGYPCTVARVKECTIALEVDKNSAAAFGNYMAKEMLGY